MLADVTRRDCATISNPCKASLPIRFSMETKTAGLLAYIERNVERTLGACTRCGKCFEACPMPAYSAKLTGAQGGEIVAGVLDILRGSGSAPGAVEWTRICTQSASCIPACPENVNPMLMLRLAHIIALGSTGGTPLLADPKRDPNFFRRINAFAALQLSDAEIAEWQQ
jgi:ferredoxin